MPENNTNILGNHHCENRSRSVPLSHPTCRVLVGAGVRYLGLDWRATGAMWGEGLSPTFLQFWVVSGRARLVDGPECAANQCLIIPPRSPKRLIVTDGPLHAAYVHLLPRKPLSSRWSAPSLEPVPRAALFSQLISALADDTLGKTVIAQPYAAAILATFSELYYRERATDTLLRQSLQSLWDDVASEPHLKWTASGLARRAGLSVGHFHIRVRALWGSTPMDIVRRIRLERAADLIRTSLLTVTEIAPRVGYVSPYALSNAMCRQFGIRPRQFRAIGYQNLP